MSEYPKRDGNFLDDMGACKVCGGEIPEGHTDNCDIWKLEREVKELRAALEKVLGSPTLRVAAEVAAARNAEIAELRRQLKDASAIRLAEWCKEERSQGNGGCGACSICCSELRDQLAAKAIVLGHAATPEWCVSVDSHHKATEEIVVELRAKLAAAVQD